MNLAQILGIELPIIQAPMAGVQLGALAAAVSGAGGLGSLPCAMLTPEAMVKELELLRSCTDRPFNVNFFCHAPPPPDAAREAGWRRGRAPYNQSRINI
jgi:nitronate monooxygenase